MVNLKLVIPMFLLSRCLSMCLSLYLAMCLVGVATVRVDASPNPGAASEVVHELVKLFLAWDSSNSHKEIDQAVAQYIDYQVMAKRALGPYWSKLSDRQQEEFVKNFRHLIEVRYYPRWHRIFAKGKLTYLEVGKTNDDTIIKTQVKLDSSIEVINWDVSLINGSPKVVNLTANQKDLVARIAARFRAKIEHSGLERFLAWVKQEVIRAFASTEDDASFGT